MNNNNASNTQQTATSAALELLYAGAQAIAAPIIILAIFGLALTGLHFAIPSLFDETTIFGCLIVVWCAYTGALLARAHGNARQELSIDVSARSVSEDELQAILAALSGDDDSQGEPRATVRFDVDHDEASTATLIHGLRSLHDTDLGLCESAKRLVRASANRLEKLAGHK